MRFSASLAAFLNFKIQNDRNTRSFQQKFNMHIAEMAKWSGKGGPPGLYKRWRPLGVELALFRISGCFCDFQTHCDFPAIFKFKRTKMYGNWGNILPGTPLLKDFNMPFVVSPLGPRRPIRLSQKTSFHICARPRPLHDPNVEFSISCRFSESQDSK